MKCPNCDEETTHQPRPIPAWEIGPYVINRVGLTYACRCGCEWSRVVTLKDAELHAALYALTGEFPEDGGLCVRAEPSPPPESPRAAWVRFVRRSLGFRRSELAQRLDMTEAELTELEASPDDVPMPGPVKRCLSDLVRAEITKNLEGTER